MDCAASSPLTRAEKAAVSLLLYRKKARQRFRAKNIRSSLTRFFALRLPTTFLWVWSRAAEQITHPATSNCRIHRLTHGIVRRIPAPRQAMGPRKSGSTFGACFCGGEAAFRYLKHAA